MALPNSLSGREKDKFVETGGEVGIRIIETTALNTSDLFSDDMTELEEGKFVEDINGDVAIVLLAA